MTLPDVVFSSVQRLNYHAATGNQYPPKTRVLLLYIVYPLAMGTYFRRALERHPDVDLKVCGPYTGTWIPWSDAQNPSGMNLLPKYAIPPDLPLPFPPNVGRVNYEFVKTQLGDWTPDIVIAVDAGINWVSKPQDGISITVATDPHVLDYSHQRKISDKFFNMQKCYSEKDDIYLPYAYSAYDHYPIPYDVEWDEKVFLQTNVSEVKKDLDAILIGMPYENRVAWKNELGKHGVFLHLENGPVFDEYRALANRAKIGCTWSSRNDLIARFFETPAFGLPMVANRVPDAHLFLTEDEDYLAFSTLSEAVEKVLYLKNNPEAAERMAQNGYRKIQPHTYDARVSQILKECGYEG